MGWPITYRNHTALAEYGCSEWTHWGKGNEKKNWVKGEETTLNKPKKWGSPRIEGERPPRDTQSREVGDRGGGKQ